MRNCLFRFKAKFRETTSLFCETRNLFRFMFREIRNETSFAGNPRTYCPSPNLGTCCHKMNRDVLSRGRFVQGAVGPRDVLSGRRFVQGTLCPGEQKSRGRTCKEMLYFPHHYHSQCIQLTLLKIRS
jgi:hypothetical protein